MTFEEYFENSKRGRYSALMDEQKGLFWSEKRSKCTLLRVFVRSHVRNVRCVCVCVCESICVDVWMRDKPIE